jgi:hypothetical protein
MARYVEPGVTVQEVDVSVVLYYDEILRRAGIHVLVDDEWWYGAG